MSQLDIWVKSLIPSCQTLARTAAEFTECNFNSASMRKEIFTALIGHLADCTWCKMDFPLNQQKKPSEIQHRAPASQILFKVSVHSGANEKYVLKNKICVLPEEIKKKKNTDWYHTCSNLKVSLSAVNRCSVLISCIAKFSSVGHLHHDVSVVHTTTTHAFVPFTYCITAPHADYSCDYKSHWMTHLPLHEDTLIQ